MHRAAIALLLVAGLAPAQALVTPAGSLGVRQDFAPHPGEETLRCEVTPIRPVINLAFRVEAGYVLHVPRSQYTEPDDGWTVLTTIAPEHGDPTYLLAHTRFAEAPTVYSNFDIKGAYFLGTGHYSVDAVLRDARNRVCRQHWQVVVALSHADRAVPLALPPASVRELARLNVPDTGHPDDGAPMRLTILLNAASFSRRRTSIAGRDRERIADALTALVEHLPASSIRLVAFSLEQRKEVYRADSFHPEDLAKIADAISATPQTTVDIGLLKNPLGHVDFLAGLIRRELESPDPAGAVIFLGPTSRYFDKIPKDALPAGAPAHPRFFYVRYEAFARPVVVDQSTTRPDRPTLRMVPDPSHGQPDIITRAVAQLNGKTLIVHSPAELADAIRKIEGHS